MGVASNALETAPATPLTGNSVADRATSARTQHNTAAVLLSSVIPVLSPRASWLQVLDHLITPLLETESSRQGDGRQEQQARGLAVATHLPYHDDLLLSH